jgi:hypothetical protein
MNRKLILSFSLFLIFISCKKEENIFYNEADDSIQINEKISIDNGYKLRSPKFNLIIYDDFLNYLSSSDHFLIVPLKDFKNTVSNDKVVISLRYDIDDNINASVKFAYREHKYGIKSTFFVLHTAKYYGDTRKMYFRRNDNIQYYLKKIQDSFDQEIGFHNDLVTLQVIYGIEPKEFLKNELEWLRGNNINIVGTTYHGSTYCYIYKYFNTWFWNEYADPNGSDQYVTKGYTTFKIEKDDLMNYNFEYEGGLLKPDYFFTDANFVNGKRWNLGMVNLDTIKSGKKVIILLHPEHWD